VIDGTTAAAIVEPVQGEGGIRVPDADWLRALRRRCDEVGALLVCDEVQCGLGRTGTLWAHEAFDIEPDMMTLAKPLAGGLPMGAVLMNRRVAEAVVPGSHATTFGGGPLVARVALRVLRTIGERDFLAAVRRKGALLRSALHELSSPLIREIRGAGLIAGIQVAVPPAEVTAAALDEGLLVAAAGESVVRLVPALTISVDELREGVARLGRALDRVGREVRK
jgi:acetylornithine/succinyldiaminopimelate/putrescine aminotransferase